MIIIACCFLSAAQQPARAWKLLMSYHLFYLQRRIWQFALLRGSRRSSTPCWISVYTFNYDNWALKLLFLLIFIIKNHSEWLPDCMMPTVYDATSWKSCLFLLLWLHEISKSNMPFDNWYFWIAQMRLNTVIYDSSGNCRVAAKCTLPLVFTNLSRIFHLAASNFKQHRPSRVKMINRRCTAAPNNKKTFSSEFHFIKFVFRFATNLTPTRTSSSLCATSWATCGSGERRIIDLYCNLFATLFLLMWQLSDWDFTKRCNEICARLVIKCKSTSLKNL